MAILNEEMSIAECEYAVREAAAHEQELARWTNNIGYCRTRYAFYRFVQRCACTLLRVLPWAPNWIHSMRDWAENGCRATCLAG